MPPTNSFLPPPARERAEQLEEHTDTPATIAREGGLWRLDHASDRIHLICWYGLNSAGEWRQIRTALYVDGQPHAYVNGYEAYKRLWDNPDIDNPNRRHVGDVPLIELEPEDLPEKARWIYERYKNLVDRRDDLTLRVGHPRVSEDDATRPPIQRAVSYDPDDDADTQRYTLALHRACATEGHPGSEVHLALVATPFGGMYVPAATAAVDCEGYEAGQRQGVSMADVLEQILGLKMPSSGTPSPAAPPPGADTKGGGFNSVAQRRHSVIRV